MPKRIPVADDHLGAHPISPDAVRLARLIHAAGEAAATSLCVRPGVPTARRATAAAREAPTRHSPSVDLVAEPEAISGLGSSTHHRGKRVLPSSSAGPWILNDGSG